MIEAAAAAVVVSRYDAAAVTVPRTVVDAAAFARQSAGDLTLQQTQQ